MHRRRVWVRQPVQRRVRRAQRGTEPDALQRRRVLRPVLPHHLRRLTPGRRVLQARQLHHRLGHQLVPAQLYALPNGGWCGPGRPHFDMSQPVWEHIGDNIADNTLCICS